MNDQAPCIPRASHYAVSAAPASRAALLARFARIDSLRSVRSAVCFSSTVWSQYPKLAPQPAKTGYAHRDPLLNHGRISRPSCHSRVATPAHQKHVRPIFSHAICSYRALVIGMERGAYRSLSRRGCGRPCWRRNWE